ncbi:MAG TPA: glycosyltransferase family 4 protein [Burkholderiales bacterium]|nr:glycosyltransferase family 4 protein [Burkholderiales bacterium]
MKRPCVLICGPSLEAISGVTTHVRSLLDSRLGSRYSLRHFQIGSEGRNESLVGRVLRLFTGPFQLAATILRDNVDIVHLNPSLNANAWWRDFLLLIAAKACGARVVLQKHGGHLERFAAHPLFAGFMRLALRLPDAIVVLSRAELDSWQAFVPGQRIALLPNGIDPRPYREKKSAPGADLRYVYIGRLAAGKGLDESLCALARIRGRLTIAGGGPEEARLRQLVHDLNLTERVTFAGPVFGEKKIELLRESDVLLLPSYSEGLPYSLLEAMAAGVVPVVTPVGAIPDVVIDGVHGRLVPVRDANAIAKALQELQKNPALLERMGAACRLRVNAAYSLDRLADDFDRLYSALTQWPASQAG